jgi:hypothetical protein
VDEVAEALLALHSADPASVFLSVCARLKVPSIAAVERALYEDRSLVRHHAMRRTLWVMAPDVATRAHAAFTRRITAPQRRRTAKMFGRDEAWLVAGIEEVVAAVVAAGGPVSTREIGQLLPHLAEPITVNAGKRYEAVIVAHTRMLLQAAFDGRIIRTRPQGSWIGSHYAWAATESWVDIDWDSRDEHEALIELLAMWLGRFGPATLDDIVWWTGATRTRIRKSLQALDTIPVQLEDRREAYLLSEDIDSIATTSGSEGDDEPWVALLPGLDPTAMGWKHRQWYLPPAVATRVTDRNGNIGPTVWADGIVVGGWVQRRDGSIAHDATLNATHRRLLGAEIERLQAIVGDTRISVRFPAPNQKVLLEAPIVARASLAQPPAQNRVSEESEKGRGS